MHTMHHAAHHQVHHRHPRVPPGLLGLRGKLSDWLDGIKRSVEREARREARFQSRYWRDYPKGGGPMPPWGMFPGAM